VGGSTSTPAGALGEVVCGLWVHLEWDVARQCAELRFVWDTDDGTLEILPVPLRHSSLAAAMDAALVNADRKAGTGRAHRGGPRPARPGRPGRFDVELIRGAVLLVLYLCIDDADVSDPGAAVVRRCSPMLRRPSRAGEA
jgi:hypothetical protein